MTSKARERRRNREEKREREEMKDRERGKDRERRRERKKEDERARDVFDYFLTFHLKGCRRISEEEALLQKVVCQTHHFLISSLNKSAFRAKTLLRRLFYYKVLPFFSQWQFRRGIIYHLIINGRFHPVTAL